MTVFIAVLVIVWEERGLQTASFFWFELLEKYYLLLVSNLLLGGVT